MANAPISSVAADRQSGPSGQPSKSELAVKLLRRLSLEVGPTLVFAGLYYVAGILWATAGFMAACAVSIVITWIGSRRLPIVPFLGAGLVLLFGMLTLAYEAPRFIQMRPTVVNGFFSLALLAGMLTGRNLLQMAFRDEVTLRDAAWRRLTWRVALYLLFLAGLNELVRLSFAVDIWVVFKAFVLLPLNAAFALSQLPMIASQLERADATG